MKEIKMFIQSSCPHCLLAKECLRRLLREDERYGALTIREIDERQEPALAESFDYWYVPCFYVGDEKLHEGHAEYEDVKRVLDAALDA